MAVEAVDRKPERGNPMKKSIKNIVSVILAAVMVLSMVGCGKDPQTPEKKYDVPAVVQSILKQVTFADTLSAVGTSATLYFPDLPEKAKVELYTGSGYFADEVALITLSDAADMKAAKASVQAHIAQLRGQFQNYIPQEVGKIDKAFIWEYEEYIVVCISDDHASAKLIVDHASDPNWQLSGGSNATNGTTVPPQTTTGTTPPETTVPPQTTTPPATTVPPVTYDPSVQLRPDGYPALVSQSGTYVSIANGSMIRVDNRAFELYGYNEAVATTYAELVSKVAVALKGETTVYSLPIPTAIGVVMPDDIQALYKDYRDQGEDIYKVLDMMDDSVVPVQCYDNLMRHRNEYLYFRTDHHWNGIGAYYAYEAFCETKGIPPYTMQQREEVQFDNFLGTLYINSGKLQELQPTDTVYAYKPYSKSATMVFYDSKGNAVNWSIISDVTNYQQSNKYSTFAGADNPLAVFTNPEVTDGSVCIVVKESYGNALLPYLVDHYSTIYEVDYRYWSGDLATYAKQVGADDLIFANNIMMINTGILVGKLDLVIN